MAFCNQTQVQRIQRDIFVFSNSVQQPAWLIYQISTKMPLVNTFRCQKTKNNTPNPSPFRGKTGESFPFFFGAQDTYVGGSIKIALPVVIFTCHPGSKDKPLSVMACTLKIYVEKGNRWEIFTRTSDPGTSNWMVSSKIPSTSSTKA